MSELKIASLQSAQIFDEQKFTKQVLFSTERSIGIVLNFLHGQELPPHPHPGREVVITVLQGSGSGRLGKKTFTFSEQDTFHCTGEEELSITNSGSKPLSIYVLLYKV